MLRSHIALVKKAKTKLFNDYDKRHISNKISLEYTYMLSSMQSALKECLLNSPIFSQDKEKLNFAGRSVQKAELKNELEKFILSKSCYTNITDKKLIERFCALCNTTPDARFNPKDEEKCTKLLLNILIKQAKHESNEGIQSHNNCTTQKKITENTLVVNHEVGVNEELFSDALSDLTGITEHAKIEIPDDTPPKDEANNEMFYDAEGTSLIKFLSKEQSQTLQKEALEAFNLVCTTNHKTLDEMIKSGKPFLTRQIMDVILAIISFSEEFQGQSLMESVNTMGLKNTEIAEYLLFLQTEKKERKDYRDLIGYQEDLDSLVSNIQYCIKDVKNKVLKITGNEDPDIKFLSVDEYSIHSNSRKRKTQVTNKLAELKKLAQSESLHANDKLQATIEYIMYEVQTEILHSVSRVTELGFNENPFYIDEVITVTDNISKWQTRYSERLNRFNSIFQGQNETSMMKAYNKYFGVGGDGYEITKFGNCDLFSQKTSLALHKLDYDLGGYGKIYIYPLQEDAMGHVCNYITQGDKIMVVDTWTNINFHIKDIETFLPQYCQNEPPFALSFEEIKPGGLEIISSLSDVTSLKNTLSIIAAHYPKPKKTPIQEKSK